MLLALPVKCTNTKNYKIPQYSYHAYNLTKILIYFQSINHDIQEQNYIFFSLSHSLYVCDKHGKRHLPVLH